MTTELHQRALQLLNEFDEVEAVGLSGSASREMTDDLSDTDLCVFVADQLPDPEVRRRHYRRHGISDVRYLDGDLRVSRIDGLTIAGTEYDLLWISVSQAETLLQRMTSDFDCDEYLAGGLLETKSLLDPRGHIAGLRAHIPSYSEERARYRVRRDIGRAHFSVHGLQWMQKASHRQDVFSYFHNKMCLFDHLISALFALNRRWRAHEKRIIAQLRQFDLAPTRVADRVESILLFRGEAADLDGDAKRIRELLADVASIAQREFAGLELPSQWEPP